MGLKFEISWQPFSRHVTSSSRFQSFNEGLKLFNEYLFITSLNDISFKNVLKLFINHDSPKKTGVMIPIPQYPLYSASVEEFGLGQVITSLSLNYEIFFIMKLVVDF